MFFEQVEVAILVLFTILFTILSDITYCLKIYFYLSGTNRISHNKANPTINIDKKIWKNKKFR